MTSQPPSDPYAACSRIALASYCEREENKRTNSPLPTLNRSIELAKRFHLYPSKKSPVCIIGAGMAGLYTAMIFDSLRIPYQILEASKRCGGRMFTHKFSSGDYDYYDVGAMRFPDTPFMERTFDLVRNRLDNKVKLIPYISAYNDLNADKSFMYYNDSQLPTRKVAAAEDPFNVGSVVSDQFLQPGQPANFILDPTTSPERGILAEPRKLFLENDIESATKLLLERYDKYTMRTYIRECARNATSADINYIEMLDSSTGSYERALSEAVFDSIAFHWPGLTPRNWFCFDKGSSTLPIAMASTLRNNVKFKSPVLAIEKRTKGMVVKYGNPKNPKKMICAAVISTVSLPCLNVMDLSTCELAGQNFAQWSAIRQAQYWPAIKIGIRFSEPWWELLPTGKIVGGQSFTDLPIRRIVYPSYPEEGPKSSTLIVSYCWTEDARRFGGWIKENGTADPRLIPIVLRDLERVHGCQRGFLKDYYKGQYFAWNWSTDPYSMGAFAFFGPGEYNSIFGPLTSPAAQGQLFIAGEATSVCHAWVAGALDSSWRAVWQFLRVHVPGKVEEFERKWGKSEYWDEGAKAVEEELERGLRPESGGGSRFGRGIEILRGGDPDDELSLIERHLRLALLESVARAPAPRGQ